MAGSATTLLSPRVLVVEDEPKVARALREGLAGPALAGFRPRLRPSTGGLTAEVASLCRRCLSPRLRAGSGDQWSRLQSQAAARVAALSVRGAAPRGAVASLPHTLRPPARAAAPSGRTGATGVPEVRPARAQTSPGFAAGGAPKAERCRLGTCAYDFTRGWAATSPRTRCPLATRAAGLRLGGSARPLSGSPRDCPREVPKEQAAIDGSPRLGSGRPRVGFPSPGS
jgi:hypothetical protein